MKLWAMRQTGIIPEYGFDLDLHAEVFEACAYHRWGLFDNEVHALATLILGGGVPKNYNLQPEPALGQVLGLPKGTLQHWIRRGEVQARQEPTGLRRWIVWADGAERDRLRALGERPLPDELRRRWTEAARPEARDG